MRPNRTVLTVAVMFWQAPCANFRHYVRARIYIYVYGAQSKKPPRIGTTDRSVDLLVGRGPSTENTPDGPAKQTGRGRQKRTDRFRQKRREFIPPHGSMRTNRSRRTAFPPVPFPAETSDNAIRSPVPETAVAQIGMPTGNPVSEACRPPGRSGRPCSQKQVVPERASLSDRLSAAAAQEGDADSRASRRRTGTEQKREGPAIRSLSRNAFPSRTGSRSIWRASPSLSCTRFRRRIRIPCPARRRGQNNRNDRHPTLRRRSPPDRPASRADRTSDRT